MKRIENTKKNYEEGKKQLKSIEKNKKSVIEKLKDEETAIENLENTIQGIIREENSIGKDILISKNRLSDAELKLSNNYEEYKHRLREMYKRQKTSSFKTILSARTISEMLRGFKMLSVLAESDMVILNNLREEKNLVQANLISYQKALNAKYVLGQQKKREQLSLEKTKKNREKLLVEIKNNEQLWKKRIIQYQHDIENAQNEIEEARSKIDRTVSSIKVSESLRNYNLANKKGNLSWPVNGKIINKFGTVVDPKTNTKTKNRGIEIEAKIGDAVRTIGSGVVVMKQFIRGYGNFVMIYHPPKYYTIYAHLSDILVNKDQEVKEGDVIGLAGNSGLIDDTKAILTLEILNGKNPENPSLWLKP